MLPYNTGKYHTTPEGVPMLHTVDHSLTETVLSLSPSSQFMYEPEVLESTSCGGGQPSQGSTGPPTLEIRRRPGEDLQKTSSEVGVISPTVEGMTFEDYVDPEELFSPPADGFAFNDCLQFGRDDSTVSTPRLIFGEGVKQDGGFYESGKELEFDDCKQFQQVFAASLDNLSYSGDQIASESFGISPDAMSFDERDKLDSLIPYSSELGGLGMDGMNSDWFASLDKDIYEAKDTDVLLADPVFSGGPTLTQLNSKDLDSTCMDDFNILRDLYVDSFPMDEQQSARRSEAPVSIDLAALLSKFPIGVSAGALTSPKFTTCTVTSFVASVSASGVPLPQYPVYIANEVIASEMMAGRDLGYLRGAAPPELERRHVPQNPWSLFAGKSPLISTLASPCFVPVPKSNAAKVVDDLSGGVVATGGGTLSTLVVPPAEAAKLASKPLDRSEPLKSDSVAEDWEEIGCLFRDQSRGERGLHNPDGNRGRLRQLKVEPQDVTFNSGLEELTDRESALEDSDLENADIDDDDNSEDDSFLERSDEMDDEPTAATGRKGKKYFWQYNTQLKGPKGKRLCKSVETEDPHVLHDFEDPVFDPEQNQTRYKHNGKARRGDGNDVTPSPHKLFVTGNELRKLNRLINAIVPSGEMPASARGKLLKEKNKYASRACRLKKKAQHEANKIKLHGLELEHRQLMKIFVTIKKEIVHRVRRRDDLATEESLTSKLDSLINKHRTLNVAGQTADYVNTVLQNVAKGDRTGGIILDD